MVPQIIFCAGVFWFWWCTVSVSGDLSVVGTRCGSLTCKEHEYCNPFDRQCMSCASICDQSHHNYQPDLCVKDCQDYIHDVRYVKTGISASSGVDLAGDIKKLYTLASLALTLICLLILVLLGVSVFKIYRWTRSNDIKDVWKSMCKKHEDVENKTHPNNGVTVPNGKKDLRLDMPETTVAPSETSPATLTTTVTSRRPAEDSALDYAYDNRAMSGTPSPHSAKTTRESNF